MNKILLLLSVILLAGSCSTGAYRHRKQVKELQVAIPTNPDGAGPEITVDLKKGKSFYYPLMAVWIEDSVGHYIQSLFVPKSVATGVFKYGKQENNKWVSALKRAPQTLPYWAHKRGIRASDGLFMPDDQTRVPDAYSGPTPTAGFVLTSRADKPLPDRFRVMMEINQNWDWNNYWTNDKYPEDENYKNSAQPAIVFEADIDIRLKKDLYIMKAIGHSHYSGRTGELFSDLRTITTALNIADSITVRIK